MRTSELAARKAGKLGPSHQRKGAGFTIVELVVVLATTGLLVMMLLPALGGTKTDSKSFRCMNNMRELATAWTMYAGDNGELLVNLSTYCGSGVPITAHPPEGVPWRCQAFGGQGGPLLTPTDPPLPAGITANTTAAQAYIIDLSFSHPVNAGAIQVYGPLFSYCNNADVLHCPADKRQQLPCSPGYQGPSSWDSYSGSQFLNGESRYLYPGFPTPNPLCITKRTGVLHPAGRFIWTEGADMRGENLGSWVMAIAGTQANSFAYSSFVSSPAAFHENSGDFNFCDGHVEIHHWVVPATVTFANSTVIDKNDSGASPYAQYGGNLDAVWTAGKYAGPQNP